MKILYPLGIVGASVLSAFSCYSTLFWGWVTATPLTVEQLARAQYNTYAWFAIFVACWAGVFVLAILWLRSARSADKDRSHAQ